MSKRKSRKPASVSAEEPASPIRAFVDAAAAQRNRILETIEEKDYFERYKMWNSAANDPECDREIESLFEAALASIPISLPGSSAPWIKRISDILHVHKRMIRCAAEFGGEATAFIQSGRPLVAKLLYGAELESPPGVKSAWNKFMLEQEQHSKLVGEILVELKVLEHSTCLIRWEKKTRELWYRGSVIKKFSRNAASNQETILDKFEEAKWERSIESPVTKTKRNETLRQINKYVADFGIVFRSTGDGRIEWIEEKR